MLSNNLIVNKINLLSQRSDDNIDALISHIGENVMLPDANRNYTVFDNSRVNKIVSYREKALPKVEKFLSKAQSEKQVVEGLYILDRMIDANVKGVEKTYPTISRFNNTNSPTVQVFLAGIYRKTQVPDGFGPLMKMMIRHSMSNEQPKYFDPTEEIGGAMLEYLRNKNAAVGYLDK